MRIALSGKLLVHGTPNLFLNRNILLLFLAKWAKIFCGIVFLAFYLVHEEGKGSGKRWYLQ